MDLEFTLVTDDSLKRGLADAVRRGDTAAAARFRAALDRLAPAPNKARETR